MRMLVLVLLTACSSAPALETPRPCAERTGRYVVHRERVSGTCPAPPDEELEADVFTGATGCKQDVDVQGCSELFWYGCPGDVTRTGVLEWSGASATGVEVTTGDCAGGFTVKVTPR